MWLGGFFQNKESGILRKIFFKDNVLLHHLETGIDRQFGVLNNLNLDEMETKSKSNLSNMEQKELK